MRINRGIRQQLLVAGLGVSLVQPVALGVVGSILLGADAGEAKTQQTLDAEAIAQIAQAITVRIEGATQGSGVLVKREGNRYTVLTAWHVVSGQRPGEEVAIYTPDGKSHGVVPGSIMRVGQVDLAILTFTSEITYQLAQIGDMKSVSSGSSVFVGGFPMATSSIPSRVFRFRDGRLEANAQIFIPNGHQMLYTNQTLPGMSGGAVLNQEGRLVGIHASAERADQISESSGKPVATGTNQGVPISYYRRLPKTELGADVSKAKAVSNDPLEMTMEPSQGKDHKSNPVLIETAGTEKVTDSGERPSDVRIISVKRKLNGIFLFDFYFKAVKHTAEADCLAGSPRGRILSWRYLTDVEQSHAISRVCYIIRESAGATGSQAMSPIQSSTNQMPAHRGALNQFNGGVRGAASKEAWRNYMEGYRRPIQDYTNQAPAKRGRSSLNQFNSGLRRAASKEAWQNYMKGYK